MASSTAGYVEDDGCSCPRRISSDLSSPPLASSSSPDQAGQCADEIRFPPGFEEKITLRMACLIWRNTQESRQRVDVNLAHSQTSSAKMHVVRQGEYGTQVMHLFLVSFLA